MSGTLDLPAPPAAAPPPVRLGALATPAMSSPYAYPTLPTLAAPQTAPAAVPPAPVAPAAAPISPGLPPQQLMAESGGRQFGPDGRPLTPPHFAGDQADPPIGESQARASTAREVLSRHGMQLDMARFMNDGAYNNQVGGLIREDLMARYGQSRVLADAAYNAGPGRVDEWIKQYGDPRAGKITPEEWAAQIPFPETRLYLHSTGAVRGNYADRPDGAAGGFQLPFDMKAVWDEVRAKQYGAQAEASAELKGLRESMDKLAAPPPEKQVTPPEKAWGSMAMALAAIGGALTHTPLATAMNAMAGVLNGFHDRDKEATEQAFTQWKAAHEAVMQATSLRMRMYEEAMRKITDAPKEAEALMRANAAALQDTAVQGLLAKGDLMGAAAVISGGVAAAQRMDQSAQMFQWDVRNQQRAQYIFEQSQAALQDLQRARATGDQQQIAAAEQRYRDILALGAPAATAARIELPSTSASAAPGSLPAERATRFKEIKEQLQRAGTYTSDSQVYDQVDAQMKYNKDNHMPPKTADLLVDRYIAGDKTSILGFGKSPSVLLDLDNALQRRTEALGITGRDLAVKIAEFHAYAQGVAAFEAGGKLEPPVRSLSTAVDHLDLLAKASDALANNDVTFFNKYQNELAKNFGWTGPPEFDALRQTVAAEIEKAVSGGAGAVADREELKASLSRSLSHPQIRAVISGYQGLMGGQLNGFRQTYTRLQEIEGSNGADFDKKFLTPRAQEVLEKKQGGSAVPKPAGMSDAQLLDFARQTIRSNPGAREDVLNRLRGWGLSADGL